jgi:formylglycine-generating enzyme required for sulfatase activity
MDGPTIRRKRSVTIDRKAPSLSVNNEPGSPRQSPYTLSGTAFDATQVEINGEAVVVRDGGWSKAFKLNDGEHTFKITAEDDVGNRTTLDPVIVQIDTKKPTINFVAPNATERWVTNQASVLVEVKVEDESGFESIRIGGSEIPERNADGLYSRTVPLTKVDQSIEIDIVAVDQAKNKAMASLRVIRDVDRPELHIKSPAKDEEVPRGEVSVTGTVKDRTPRANCRVVVNEIRATVETDGSWSVKLPLLSGKQKIDVRAIDEAGNEGSDSRTLFVYREIEGFTFDHPNPQGHPEYHHKESGLEMIYLSGGKFRMGPTEGESRMVKLEPFLISKYEVAQKTWHEVMKTNASTLESDGLPMARVSWGDCQRFCEKVKLELPTEEQWEYACRGGRSGPYGSTGDLDDMGWFTKNSESKIHPVGEKKANDFGIHDMHGNVWEWCRDTYDDDDDDKKVFRGGSWTTGSSECESGYRLGLSKVRQRDDVGFRVVAEID